MTTHHRGRGADWQMARLEPRMAEPAQSSDDMGSRPAWVPGPGGARITLADLPPPTTSRWVVRRKAEVLAAINGGLLTASEACARYGLSPEELELWQKAVDRAGVPGLRVTRIQLYRELDRITPSTAASAKATAQVRSALQA